MIHPGRFRILVAAALLGPGCRTVPSGNASLEGSAISAVSIRYVGAHTVDEVRLNAYIGTKRGTPYRSGQIDNDIKSLYESGLVNDVRVLAEPKKRGVEVIYEVETRGVMCCGPGFVGNTAFSDQRLAEQTGLRAEQKMDGPVLITAARRLEAYYQANGYPGTKVSVRTQPAEDGGLDFIFIVEEGSYSR